MPKSLGWPHIVLLALKSVQLVQMNGNLELAGGHVATYRAQKGLKRPLLGSFFWFLAIWRTKMNKHNNCQPRHAKLGGHINHLILWEPLLFVKNSPRTHFGVLNCLFMCQICPTMHFWGGWRKPSRQPRSDTKLETYVNYQMSNLVVQENHQEKFHILCNHHKVRLYFRSLLMLHPVVQLWG